MKKRPSERIEEILSGLYSKRMGWQDSRILKIQAIVIFLDEVFEKEAKCSAQPAKKK